MRQIQILYVLFAFTISSCIYGQYKPKVTGSGKVVTEERKAGYFDAIRVSTGIDVYLTQGASERIAVEADDNLHEYIMTEISGNTLKIYTEANIRKAERKRVYVTMKDVKELSASSAGDIVGKNSITTDELFLSASSAGDIELQIKAQKVECKLSSSGDMTLEGEADELDADLSSAGSLKAYDLVVKVADITTSSAGDARITVTEKLRARASSAGDIYYAGDPKEVDAHSSSAGGIHKK